MRRYVTIDIYGGRGRLCRDCRYIGLGAQARRVALERLAERYEYERAVMPPIEPVKRWPERG